MESINLGTKNIEYSKLKWMGRRGMLELDIILSPFIDSEYYKLSNHEIEELEQLLFLPDPTLYQIFIKKSNDSNLYLNNIISVINNFRNKKNE